MDKSDLFPALVLCCFEDLVYQRLPDWFCATSLEFKLVHRQIMRKTWQPGIKKVNTGVNRRPCIDIDIDIDPSLSLI